MYHPQVIDQARARLEATMHVELTETPVTELEAWRQRFTTLFDKKGQTIRALDQDEQHFILSERLLSKISFRYWAERYAVINIGGVSLGTLYPLWMSQSLILDEIGRIEWERTQSGHPDGVIIEILKARQLGCSTLMSAILCHRLTTAAHTTGLLASDVPDNSAYLADMFERTVDNLDFWMKPTIQERVKNDEVVFATDSRLFIGASKSTRGAEKASRTSLDGRKGQLGRGKTLSVVHLSELATWTNPAQIDSSLMPAIPVTPSTFLAKESTAQGFGSKNWFYNDWQLAKAGRSRTTAVFIPWFSESTKYWLPCPVDWTPDAITAAHARRAEEFGPRWMHNPVRLSREQIYWWEMNRKEAEAKDALGEFLQEFPADDEEAFQLSGRSIFSVQLRERVKSQMRPMVGVVDIRPNREVGGTWRTT